MTETSAAPDTPAQEPPRHDLRSLSDILDAVEEAGQNGRVSVGENFRFGRGAEGDAALLGSQNAFETRVVPLVEVEGETVSSSHIRGLVAAGEVDQAARFLGRPFLFQGEVVGGDGALVAKAVGTFGIRRHEP